MNNIPIIDTHLHLWDVNQMEYPWLTDIPSLNKSHLPADYLKAVEGLQIEKMVFVQCEVNTAQYEQEIAWVTTQAVEESRIKGIVAWVPLEKGNAVYDTLGLLCEKYPLLRGVRRIIQFEDDTAFCLNKDFIKGVQLLSDFNLHFEICIKGDDQFKNTLQLIKQCPDTRFILDHIGKPYIKEKIMDPWKGYMRELAAIPNTYCKISGLINEADMENWTPDDIHPYLDSVLNTFGFNRVTFGGDWPVVTLGSSYKRWMDILWNAVSGCTVDEQAKLFYRNAAGFYRI